MKKKVTSLQTLVIQVYQSTLNIVPQWISKLCIWKHKNRSKASNGAEIFAHNLHACKKSRYNVWDCKSGRHNWCHTFERHNTQHKPSLTNIPYYGLKVKGRKNRKTKTPSPCWQNRTFRALNICQEVGNNHLSTDLGYDNYSCINFPFHPDKGIIPQLYLLYTNNDKKMNYPLMDTSSESVSIVSGKLTKKQSHIINDISIPGCLSHSGFSQRFKLNNESPNMSEKDLGLPYCLIERLLLTRKITRPDVHACVSYIITRIELPTNYHKDRNLNTDALFKKKIQMFVLSSTEDQKNHFETLFYEHTNYVLIILQQIIQLRRFKKVSTVLKGVLKNMIKWLDSSIYTNFTKYITDHQEHTTKDTRKAKNELINQGVKIAND